MASQRGREALRGAEEETLDLLAETLTPKQWAELLKAPLDAAVAIDNRGLAQKLVLAGAEIGEALHVAVERGHRRIASDLLENGASIAAMDTRGDTPLHCAARSGEPEMMKLLLLKGADKDALDQLDRKERPPLVLAAAGGHTSAALALMAAGADTSLRYGRLKRSVLHRAAHWGHPDVLRAVIEHGADVNATAESGWTPLHAAASSSKMKAQGNMGVIDVLVEAGANIEARDNLGCVPLHYAAQRLALENVLTLLKHGASVNPQDRLRRTPLYCAVRYAGDAGVVDFLLMSGADETILNNEGEAAADVVGIDIRIEDRVDEDAERVRELLANAPADRAWRRRGYLVLCRSHPDRMQLMQESSSAPAASTRSIASGAALERSTASASTGASGGSAAVFEGTSSGWAGVVAMVLGLQEEGLFRTPVGYL